MIDSMLGRDSLFGVLVEDDENHHIKSVTFTDHQGAVFGPFTKMSSQLDDINLKTINFPVGLRPPFDEVSHLEIMNNKQWNFKIGILCCDVTMKVIIYMDYSLNFGVDYFYFLFSPDGHHDSEYSWPEPGVAVYHVRSFRC